MRGPYQTRTTVLTCVWCGTTRHVSFARWLLVRFCNGCGDRVRHRIWLHKRAT